VIISSSTLNAKNVIETNYINNRKLLKTASYYLNKTKDFLIQSRKLIVKAANGVYSPYDRKNLQVKLDKYLDECDRYLSHGMFNNRFIFFKKAPKAGKIYFTHIQNGFMSINKNYFKTGIFSGFSYQFPLLKNLLADSEKIKVLTPLKAGKSIGTVDILLARTAIALNSLSSVRERLTSELVFQKALYSSIYNKRTNPEKIFKQSIFTLYKKILALSLKAANGVYSPFDRKFILNKRMQQLKAGLVSMIDAMHDYSIMISKKNPVRIIQVSRQLNLTTINKANRSVKICLQAMKKIKQN